MLTIRQVLAMDPFAQARVVAGEAGLDREARGAHPAVSSQIGGGCAHAGELLLTTLCGYRDDGEDSSAQADLCATFGAGGLAGMVVAVGGAGPDHAPDAMRQAADAANFPLIELPWSVPFAEVVRAVSERIIDEQRALYQRSTAIHCAFTQLAQEGGSLSAVATALSRLLNRAVEIDDLTFTQLAIANVSDTRDTRETLDNTDSAEMDESRRNAMQTHHHSAPLLDHLRTTGALAKVRVSLAPIRIDPDAQTRALGMTAPHILAPIVVARAIYGYIWISADEGALELLDFHAIEQAATVAALILMRDEVARQAEERAERRVVDRLLTADARLDTTLREEAARFHLSLEAPHAVIVVDPGANDMASVELVARASARRSGGAAVVGERAGRVVVIVACGHAETVDDHCQRLLTEARFLEAPIHIGASPPHAGVAALQRAYEEALEALTLAPALGEGRQIAHFDDLGLLHWLYTLPPGALAENAYARRLQRLAESDRARDADLLHTLDVFLECDGNGVRAAERLIIHRHTLTYRLRRIEEMCEVDLSDPFCKLNLRAALLSQRLRVGHNDG